jgi:hypothetical protein
MNLTGGWHWHWRAWRSQHRWAAASAEIETWLLAQTMPRQQLVLIGASAGWMLPSSWLTQFDEIHAWDIDPWAAPLFRWRHGPTLKREGIALRWHTEDGLARLNDLVQAMPHAFFWFDNVLGQLRFTDASIDAVSQGLRQIRQLMAPVAWGSVHDLMSGRTSKDATPILVQKTQAGLAMNGPQSQAWLREMGAISPWLDHLSDQVLPPGTPVQHLVWPFKPGYAHWLEMGWLPAGPRSGNRQPLA